MLKRYICKQVAIFKQVSISHSASVCIENWIVSMSAPASRHTQTHIWLFAFCISHASFYHFVSIAVFYPSRNAVSLFLRQFQFNIWLERVHQKLSAKCEVIIFAIVVSFFFCLYLFRCIALQFDLSIRLLMLLLLPLKLISERKTHYLVDYYILHLWLYMAQQDHFNYNVSGAFSCLAKYVLSKQNLSLTTVIFALGIALLQTSVLRQYFTSAAKQRQRR